MSGSQVKSGTLAEALAHCRAVATIRRSCISLRADNFSEQSRMLRSSGTTTNLGSELRPASRAATEPMPVLPRATAQHASAKAMIGTNNRFPGSYKTPSALLPKRWLPERNQMSAWASTTYSLAIGGVPFLLPLGKRIRTS